MLEYIYSTKNTKQHRRVAIWHTRCKHLTIQIFEDQANCLEQDCFSVNTTDQGPVITLGPIWL